MATALGLTRAVLRPRRSPFSTSRSSSSDWCHDARPAHPVRSFSTTFAPGAKGHKRMTRNDTPEFKQRVRQANREQSAPFVDPDDPKVVAASSARNLMDRIMPNTFVRLPISQFPRQPRALFRYLYLWLRTRFVNLGSDFSLKFQSRPAILKKSKYIINRRRLVPTAKALHVNVSEALARGDTQTLRKECISKLANRLIAVVEARPRGRHSEWSLVRYNKAPFYPRVADTKVHMTPTEAGTLIIRQAVVSIASRQRIVDYDGDRVVGEREADVIEQVVMCASVDTKTYQTGEWLYMGTIGETSLKDAETQHALMQEVKADPMRRFKGLLK